MRNRPLIRKTPDPPLIGERRFHVALPERGYRVPNEENAESVTGRRRTYRPRKPLGDGGRTPASVSEYQSDAPVTDPDPPAPATEGGGVEGRDGTGLIAPGSEVSDGGVSPLEQSPSSSDAESASPARPFARVETNGWRDGGRGQPRGRGRSTSRPAFDGSVPPRRDGPPPSPRAGTVRGSNSMPTSGGRPMRGAPATYTSSLGRMPSAGDGSTGFRSIGRSPEEIARLAQEARREARLTRGRMFRAAAIGQTEPYRALGRGPSTPPWSGSNGNVGDRFGGGRGRPQSRPDAPRGGRPPVGR